VLNPSTHIVGKYHTLYTPSVFGARSLKVDAYGISLASFVGWRKEVMEMLGVKVLMALGIGVVLTVVGLVVVYPLWKTLVGGVEVLRAWAEGVELRVTLADGGQRAE